MKKNILDIIDFEKVDSLLEGYNKSTGFVTAILDLEGNVLSKSGWRQMCIDFHRANPETSKKCKISDTVLAGRLAEGEKYHFYECLNGLVDVAVPLVINGEHIANLFSGQLFFEAPNRKFFKKQAEKYGFDEEKYLAALDKVPVVSKEKVKVNMDFLLNMTKLISEMTFQKLQQIQHEEALQKSIEQQRSILHTAMDGYWFVDMEGNLLEVNQTYCRLSGYTEEELLKMNISDLDVEESKLDISAHIKKIHDRGDDRFETRHRRKDGSIFDVEISVQYRPIENGRIVVFLKDITEKKKSEQSNRILHKRLDRIASNVPGAIYEFCLSPDGTTYIPYASEGFNKIYGLDPEILKADASPLFELIHPEDLEIVRKSIAESAEKLTTWHSENRVNHPSGEIIWVEGKSTPQKLNDGTIIWQGYVNDITDRKNAEKMLHESEEKYRQLYESNQMPISIFDTETLKFLSVNKAFVKKYGYTTEEFLNMTILDIRPESEIEKLKESAKIIDKGLVNAGVFLHKKKNGQIINVEIIRYDLVFEGKNAKLVFANDISDRIQADEELRTSEAKFRATAEYSPLAIYASSGPDQKGEYVNPAFSEIFGFTLEDVPTVGVWWIKAFPDEKYRQWVMETWQKNIEDANKNNTNVAPLECVCNCKDGTQKIISWEGSNIGEGFWAFGLDLTERVEAENALRISEEKFEESFRLSPYLVSLTAMDGHVLEVNDMIFDTFGYTREEFLNNNTAELPLWVHPEERVASIKKLKDDGILREMDVKFRKKSGKIGDFLLSAVIIELNKEKVLLSIIHDVSERKEREKALRESEEKFSVLFGQASLPAALTQFPDHELVDVNDSWLKLFGYTKDEVIGKTAMEIGINRDEDQRTQTYEKLDKESQLSNHELNLFSKSGEEITVLSNMNIVEINGKEFAISSIQDITERKKTEKALAESEELLRLSSKLANVAAWEFNFTTNSMSRSENHDSLYGLEPQEKWAFETFQNATHPDDREMSTEIIQKSVAIDGPDEYRFDFRVVYPDQSIHWLNVIGKVVERDSKGMGTLVRGFLIDINQRKQAEEIIIEKDREFRKLSANVPDLIFQFTRRPDGSYIVPLASEAIINIFGCTPEDVKDDFGPISRVIHPDDTDRVFNEIENSAKNLTHFNCEFRVQLPGKPLQWIYSKSSPEKLEDGSITWYGFNTNITERKQADEALKESEEKFKSSFHTNPAAQAILNEKGIFVESNDAFCKLIGFTKKQIFGKSAVDLGLLSLEERKKLAAHAKASGGIIRNAEVQFKIKDGSYRDILYSLEEIFLKGIPHRLSIGIDITERKQAEIELVKAKELLNNAIDNASVGMCLVKIDGYFSMVNKSLCEMFDYAETELTSKTFSEVTHPDDYDIGAKAVQSMIKGKVNRVGFEKRYLKKNGDVFHAKVQSSVLKDETGKPIYFFTHIENITERKQAQTALKKSEEKYKLLFELLPDSLMITRNGLVDEVNSAALELFGIDSKEEILKTDPMTWVEKESFEIAKGRLEKLYESSVKMPLAEYSIIKKSGEIRQIDAQSASMEDEKGIFSLAVLRDITKKKQAAEEIKRLNEDLEEKVKIRTEELEEKFLELERINKLFIGRELKMIELKQKIKELSNR